MTDATETLPTQRRAPHFVSRRTAAALLDLSGSGFNQWVKRGLLPPPARGTSNDEPRWEWAEIVSWMRGDRSSAPRDLLGEPAPVRKGGKRGPAPGTGGRPPKPLEQRVRSPA
jgi:hypothetical protein